MPKLISVYTGAGGLDLGLEAAGFDVEAAIELDPWACETVRANRDWQLFSEDVNKLSSRKILKATRNRVGELDLLSGGPPCQPFSKSAYWVHGDTRGLDDPRADTLTSWLRLLRDLRPRAFILENVPGLAYRSKQEGIRFLETTINSINADRGTRYTISWKVLNAANYGVPQLRERLFAVGFRDGTEFEFPEATHVDPASNGVDAVGMQPWCSAWDAIWDLENDHEAGLEATGKWANLLPSVPEGENYLFFTPRRAGMSLFRWRSRYWAFLLKLAKNRPSWTIQAQPGSATGPFHWNSRRLSIAEMRRLQTFPDNYQICGGRIAVQRQLGNAVPPLLGEVIGREILRQLVGDTGSLWKDPPTLLPTLQKNTTPDPETPAPVPRSYHHLAGDHPDHPGEGRGPGARNRAGSPPE